MRIICVRIRDIPYQNTSLELSDLFEELDYLAIILEV